MFQTRFTQSFLTVKKRRSSKSRDRLQVLDIKFDYF